MILYLGVLNTVLAAASGSVSSGVVVSLCILTAVLQQPG